MIRLPGAAMRRSPLLTLEIAKHRGAAHAVLVHQHRHGHAARGFSIGLCSTSLYT